MGQLSFLPKKVNYNIASWIKLNLILFFVVVLEIFDTLHKQNKDRRDRFMKSEKRALKAGRPPPQQKKRRKTTANPAGLSSNLNHLQNLAS